MDVFGSAGRLRPLIAIAVSALAMAAALAAGHLVAGLVGPGASPFLAVGNAVRDASPFEVTEWAKDTFGTYDKLVLLTGEAIVLLGLTVLAGLLSRRRAWPGVLVASGLGVAGVLAVLSRPDLGQLAVLAPATSLLVALVVFVWLLDRAHLQTIEQTADESGADNSPVRNGRLAGSERTTRGFGTDDSRGDRRAFLRVSAGVAVGVGVAGVTGQALASRVDVEAARSAIGRLVPDDPAPPLPARADFVESGTPRFITSNRDFYRIDTALTVPRLDHRDWRLRIHGLVDAERTFTFSDIRNRPLVARTVTLTCVSNEVGGSLISTAEFIGVPLRDLLLDAGVRPGADQLLSASVDGFTAGTPVDALLDPDRGALLAIGMNGEPLPVEHGFPARMVVPGLYGYVSATKWVVDMELTTFAAKQGYWIPRGWAVRAPIRTQSRIDQPGIGETLTRGPDGTVVVAGTAWAQPSGVARVEVRVDGGAWQSAELAAEVSGHTWRMWRTRLQVPPGDHLLECRATDHTGYTQTAKRRPPAPDGATGWHSVQFSVP